jgi:hypothetical protein
MTHIAGFDRSQLLLLPEVIDDYVDPENPVRFIDAFVDGLDLAARPCRERQGQLRSHQERRPSGECRLEAIRLALAGKPLGSELRQQLQKSDL